MKVRDKVRQFESRSEVEATATEKVEQKSKSEVKNPNVGKIKLMAKQFEVSDAQNRVHAPSTLNTASKVDIDEKIGVLGSKEKVLNAFELLMKSKGGTPRKTPVKRIRKFGKSSAKKK